MARLERAGALKHGHADAYPTEGGASQELLSKDFFPR
jgi:hypothetical protein